MTYKDFRMLKQYGESSVGMFGEKIYAYEILTGIGNVPGYYQITKQEFDSFDEWKSESIGELGTMYEVHNRKPLCSAYEYDTEVKNVDKELICPDCGCDFLVGEECPDDIVVSKICPNCNRRPEPKMELMLEVKKQLQLAGLRVRNLGMLFTSYYIDPYSKLDMKGYVSVGSNSYYLRVNERGHIIIEYRVTDKKMAAYWILKELLYSIEYELLSEDKKHSIYIDEAISDKCRKHFEKMERDYKDWFNQEIDIFNFDKIL